MRQHLGCLRYPDSQQREKNRQALDRVKQLVSDPERFMALAMEHRSAPPTEIVARGQKAHRFSFGFPVVIKSLDGRKMILAENQNEVDQHTKGLKGTGYQIQKHLRGYTFLKVRVEEGSIEAGIPSCISGAIRRLTMVLTRQGLRNFTLTVATNYETTYIIGARLD